MPNYRQKVIDLLSPDADGIRVIDTLYARGVLDSIPMGELRVMVGGRPSSKDRNAYMKWYKLAKKHDVMPPKGKTRDRDAYNQRYYRENKGVHRGAQAWERVASDAREVIERLESLSRYADMKAREIRESKPSRPR